MIDLDKKSSKVPVVLAAGFIDMRSAASNIAIARSIFRSPANCLVARIAVAGGDTIRCAPYATYGTEQLSQHAVSALEDRLACLLAHHGMIAIGPSLSKAMWLAVEVETLARQYHGCLQIGTPPLLSKAEIKKVLGKIAGYGPAGQ